LKGLNLSKEAGVPIKGSFKRTMVTPQDAPLVSLAFVRLMREVGFRGKTHEVARLKKEAGFVGVERSSVDRPGLCRPVLLTRLQVCFKLALQLLHLVAELGRLRQVVCLVDVLVRVDDAQLLPRERRTLHLWKQKNSKRSNVSIRCK